MATFRITQEHRRRNETTRDRWQEIAPHRARVMQLLVEARGVAGPSLCLLGAGNGNDVELAELAGAFERIALVDLDEQALARAVDRLTENQRRRVERHAPIDLMGVLPILEAWQADTAFSGEELANAIATARTARPAISGEFDVVASLGMLSQLIDSVYLGISIDHPRRLELVLAVRNRHLELMIELLRPGGVGVLISDFVATETAPLLAYLDDTQIPAAAIQWINERNFFTGANPYAIRDYLNGLSGTGLAVENVEVSPAWRWDIGAKQMAVCAVTFRRAR
jgi:hypothetical protein